MVKPGAGVLVVEDDEKLAAYLALILLDFGYRVFGPALTVEDALRILDEMEPAVALVDFRLSDDVTAEPLLPLLEERRVPICVITGTLRDQLPATFAKHPVLQKPFSHLDLIQELDSLSAR